MICRHQPADPEIRQWRRDNPKFQCARCVLALAALSQPEQLDLSPATAPQEQR